MTDSNATTLAQMLSQITDLQGRVSKQDSIITDLKSEIDKLSMTRNPLVPQPNQWIPQPNQWIPQHMVPPHMVHQHMVPQPMVPQPMIPRHMVSQPMVPQPMVPQPMVPQPMVPRTPPNTTNKKMPGAPVKGPNPNPKCSIPHPTMSISDVLNTDETVYMEIRNGKDSITTAVCNFDGTDLTVLEAELAESIIGLKSSKPGEILYKFMEALHKDGHITKTFGIAPWKLCFVKRNGVKKSLEELR